MPRGVPGSRQHGFTGYHAGCRCGVCRAAQARRNAASDRAGRARTDEAKKQPCMDCGGTFPPECMDFDHRPGEVKVAGVGALAASSAARLLTEIAKCDVVCSNCHRIRTRKRRSKVA